MANLKPKKPKTNNNFYWFLLLPIAAIVVLVILLIPRSKHHDWDDDEDEDEENTAVGDVRGITQSALDEFSDEELINYPMAPEPEWGGNSPAFRKEVAPGIVISASKNAFEQPTEVKFRPATKDEHRRACQLVNSQQADSRPLCAFSLDAGLQPDEHIPGYFTMEIDLEQMGIPENIWDNLCINRICQYDIVEPWNCWVKNGKLIFHSDQNSLWTICINVPIGVAVIGIPLSWTVCHARLGSYFGLTDFWTINCYNYQVYDGAYGYFKIGFRPSDTEHPDPEKMDNNIKELRKLLREISAVVYDKFQERVNPISGGTFTIWENHNEIYDSINMASTFKEYVEKNPDIKKIVDDPSFYVPESVRRIGTMFQVSHRYIRNKQGMKPPMRICGIFLGDDSLVGDPDVMGMYESYFDVAPTLFVNYIGSRYPYVAWRPVRDASGAVSQKKIIMEENQDQLFLTCCHELFHHYQSKQVINSYLKNIRMAESTAAVLERDFMKYLWEEGKIGWNPDGDTSHQHIFAPNEEKEWLMAPLDRVITPSFVNFDDLKAAFIAAVELKLKDIPRRIERGDISAMSDFVDIYQRFSITHDQLYDITGMASEYRKGPNCNAGYMLGDFIDFLRQKRNPQAKMSSFFLYNSDWDYAAALKFGVLVNDEVFCKYYTEFCAKNIGDILERQAKKTEDATFRVHYAYQYMDPIHVSRRQPVNQLKCWRNPGKYACRTAKLIPASTDDKYNLLIMPSKEMKGAGEEAVRAYIAKGDTAFATQGFYLEADSNYNQSPTGVALIMTSKIDDVTLTDSYYYDAVAYFAPEEKPEVELPINGSYRMSTKEIPSKALLDKQYVTGIQFFMKDNRTNKIDTAKVEYKKDSVEMWAFLTLPPGRAGEEPDITALARWYYQPDPNDTTCYYSPWSEESERASGPIIDNDTYIYVAGEYSDIGSQNLTSHAKGHLKVWSDGRFEWSNPAFSAGSRRVTQFQCKGKGVLGAELNTIVVDVDGAVGDIDPTSFSSSELTVFRKETNSQGEQVEVSTVYKITDVKDAFVCFTKPLSPNAPVKVLINFPKATIWRQNGGRAGNGLEITGYGKVEQASMSPFDDY